MGFLGLSKLLQADLVGVGHVLGACPEVAVSFQLFELSGLCGIVWLTA